MTIIFRLHEISHDVEILTSLVLVLVDQIEAVTLHVDQEKAAKVAADLARIAFDGLAAVLAQIVIVENVCEAAP